MPDEDRLITELRRFLESYGEHDPDCPALTLVGDAVHDPENCTCGFTVREQELLAEIADRLGSSN
jgi:hypothetical protein